MVKCNTEYLSKAVVDLTEKEPIQVLHVGDEADFLKTAKPYLEMQGAFQVETASSVEEASEKLKKKTFDAVISDYIMPGKDDLQFLKELREEGNNVPFIMFTGKGKEEVAIKALNLGADRYLNKTGDPETVYGELAYSVRRSVKAKQAEEAVRKSQQKFERLFMNNPEAADYLDSNFHILNINPRFEELFGYSLDEIKGKHINDVIVPRDKMQDAEILDEEVKNGYAHRDSVRKRKDGSLVPVSISAAPIIIEDQLVGSVGLYKDITERKNAEEALERSEERFRTLVENAPIGIYYNDFSGRFVYGNKKAEEIVGYEREELIGRNFLKLKLLGSRDILRAAKLLALNRLGKSTGPDVFTLSRKDGVESIVEISTNVVAVDGKKVVLGMVQDITKCRKAEEESKKVLEKLDVVGKLTRHDVRNKLSVVTNNVYLAKQKLSRDSEALKYLEDIESACRHMERIFNFARAYEKLGMEELAYMDVEKTLEEVVTQFPDVNGIKVISDCQGLVVLADSLLRQLFYNLIDNSLKHGEKVSRIRVHYKERGKHHLELIYEDDGIGIPKAEKEKIFKEGYGKGTGYGLYLIKKMCEVYGWAIRETGKQDKGAHFIITMPKMDKNGKTAYQLH